MITFKAHFINNEIIQKRTNGNNFQNQTASFVQLQNNNKTDVKALEQIDMNWNCCNSFANNIRSFFSDNNEPGRDSFALTTQSRDFEELNYKNILGLAHIKKINSEQIMLEYLQVDPNNNYEATLPKFQKIGTAIVKSFEKLFPGKEMILVARENAIPFYEKLGFKANVIGLFSKKL